MIPLPEGAFADQSKAGFKDGVLEITLPGVPGTVEAQGNHRSASSKQLLSAGRGKGKRPVLG
jgi:HSP20 family molecular chaperone IbpA